MFTVCEWNRKKNKIKLCPSTFFFGILHGLINKEVNLCSDKEELDDYLIGKFKILDFNSKERTITVDNIPDGIHQLAKIFLRKETDGK